MPIDANVYFGITPESSTDEDFDRRQYIRENDAEIERARQGAKNIPPDRAALQEQILREERERVLNGPRDPAGYPIDTSRPILNQPNGDFATEKSVTIGSRMPPPAPPMNGCCPGSESGGAS